MKPKWYTLESKRRPARKKDSTVSGEILLQFSLVDTANPMASPQDTYRKFQNLVCFGEEEDYFPQETSQDLEDVDRDEETSDDGKKKRKGIDLNWSGVTLESHLRGIRVLESIAKRHKAMVTLKPY